METKCQARGKKIYQPDAALHSTKVAYGTGELSGGASMHSARTWRWFRSKTSKSRASRKTSNIAALHRHVVFLKMQWSIGQRMSTNMSALSRTPGPSCTGWSRHHDGGRSVVSREPLQHHNRTMRGARQSIQIQRMQVNGLSGNTAQAQAGTKAADSQQLPELPALDGKSRKRTFSNLYREISVMKMHCMLQTHTKTKSSLLHMPTGSSQAT